MTNARHHVIIGSGIAGSEAAITLRRRDPESRVTILTIASLLVYNRYDLPKVFRGRHDWRDYLVNPPSFYDEQRIVVRRNSRVANVDTGRRVITLGHKEDIRYDTLLVASGGRPYLPEELADFRGLMKGFGSFEQAMEVYRALPEGGRMVMLGGDMIGLDLARTLVECGYRVTVLAGEYTFWPHLLSANERKAYLDVLAGMGIDIVDCAGVGGIEAVEEGAKGMPARRVVFKDGTSLHGDAVMSFFGLVPSVDFIMGSGVDIERGLLVNTELKTTDAHVWAAGDVCQIWSQEDNRYRFYYGWKNVRVMGAVAARNMTGDVCPFASTQEEKLSIVDGKIHSPFWEYD